MVREIVDYGDTPNFSAHFHASLDALERAQSLAHSIPVCLYRFPGGNHRQHVAHAERAGERRVYAAPFGLRPERPKAGTAFVELDIARVPVGLHTTRLQRIVSIRERFDGRRRLGRQLPHDR